MSWNWLTLLAEQVAPDAWPGIRVAFAAPIRSQDLVTTALPLQLAPELGQGPCCFRGADPFSGLADYFIVAATRAGRLAGDPCGFRGANPFSGLCRLLHRRADPFPELGDYLFVAATRARHLAGGPCCFRGADRFPELW
jgi:hypothetical protein